ncbi:sentrin-specific protease 6 isoform X3 [Electrophorus electricus]|uniref:sentrin-specific protease 6 isoform X3 n=1 Tax=Electrophorus electricus TaxID=8005 RepID=UPI000F09E331|nr:sentrin-specific protease 6 isoform X3 [Electrophorus electricus]
MAHKKSAFIEALDRSEARRDGGFTQSWSFSLSDDSEEERRNDASLVTMDQVGGRQEISPEGMKAPPLRHFGPLEPMKTYERRANHFKPLNRMGTSKSSETPHSMAISPLPNRTNYLIMSPVRTQGVVVQGRLFQHTHLPSPARKPVQSSLDLKERPDFTTQPIQRVELDNIILTCPEISDSENMTIQRRIQSKRRTMFEGMGAVPTVGTTVEQLQPDEYFTVCGKCGQQSEDHIKCEHCSCVLLVETTLHPSIPSSPAPRPSIRSQPSPDPPAAQLSKSFYGPASGGHSTQVDVVMNPPARITRGNQLLPHNGRHCTTAATGNAGSYVAKLATGKRQPATKQHDLSDPIILSSDDEEVDNASTGSVNRMDSISPRPADSAHSSPVPSSGRVEAAVKGAVEHEEHSCEFFMDMDHRNVAPRRNRMKDPFGNALCEDASVSKKRKVCPVQPQKLESIILECRSVRIGTLRRMVTKPVIFTVEYIQLETEGQEVDVLEKVRLRSSELTSCEWCCVRKLPVLFFQTSDEECCRLRAQLQMSQESGGLWYDCSGNNLDEKYIVLIFENGLSMQEQVILEDILVEIGRKNNFSGFPARLSFDEANVRLVQYNKASKEKEKAKAQKAHPISSSTMTSPTTTTTVSVSVTTATAAVTMAAATTVMATTAATTESTVRTRMSTHLNAFFDEDDDEDMAELHPTFTGPVVKLIVYPPPPAKGGISVTNEDLHCLNDGEFLNDVIIDFYLKYLFMEKLRKEDALRSHVFSSFFYKRLNQRERRSGPDTTNLPIQKRKHNRVKTWTRHVDLFQKDFIFVPINESAHWYLAVICFPGLEGVHLEDNPLYQPQLQSRGSTPASAQLGTSGMVEGGLEEPSPHTEPLSFSQTDLGAEGERLCEPRTCHANMSSCPHQPPEHPCPHSHELNGEVKVQSHYTNALRRISMCYGRDDPASFSDDQSSSQDECSEDGALADEGGSSESMEWTSKPNICKQPCILIMDSLRGPARSSVVKTLREYLEVEWEVRKGSPRSFGKDVMKGSSPRVPQQDNFSDCGVYVLQYVESFFENPLPSFHLPMNLLDWFPHQRMKTKRDEIKELILKLQSQQQLDRESLGQVDPCESPCEDLDVGDTLESADLIPPVSS